MNLKALREQRMRALAAGEPVRKHFRAEYGAAGQSGEIWLYDAIDPWGGYWGISAQDIVQALQGVGDVLVHINSPGGDVFEAIAIRSTFRQHPGNVTMQVESLAASAASMVMLAGTSTVIEPDAMVMIHDAWGIEIGNAEALRKHADLLDRTSQNIASMYHAKAGDGYGTVDEWRARMQAETWYVGAEAVEAGLVNSVVGAEETSTPPADLADLWDPGKLFAKAPRPAVSDTRAGAGAPGPDVSRVGSQSGSGSLVQGSISPDVWAQFRARQAERTSV